MNNEGEMLSVRPYEPDENGVNFDEQQLFIPEPALQPRRPEEHGDL